MSTPRSALEALSAAGLLDLHDKVRAGARLSAEDGLRLFQCPDVAAVGHLANIVRERLHGNLTWYNRNLHVNATNVCEASCIFCSFARLETGDPNAWTMSYDQALDRIKVLDDALVTEVHIVNGLNPDLPYDYYLELMRRIKAHRPDIHVKGFTAVEIHYYAEKYGMTVAAVLQTMREAGLDSMPGGGAEIFADRARRKLCHDKVDAQGWLDIHAEAHRQGIFTNCTMLFGSIETLEERVDHLLRLRDLQDRSLREGAMLPDHGGAHFQTFIPLRFHNDNNRLARLASPTGHDSLRTIAVARLLLDNIPHVKAYWPMLGTDEAQAALWYGASDLDGTVREEHIYHMAGAETPQGLSPDDLVRFIRHAGRLPAERDTLYNVVSRKDPARPTTPATRVKVGWVDYSNAAPLVRHLDGVERIGGHPSEVAARLSRGEVELALLPVGALLSDAAQADRRGYRVVPDVCIGCDGDVDSVLLAADVPPEQWTAVRLDGVSRTSVLLARLLLTHPDSPLAKRVPEGIELLDVAPTTGASGAGGTVAALVIGDAAHALGDRLPERVDLGGAWKQWTGLPFVFAVWAGRAHVPADVVEHIRAAGLKGVSEVQDGSFFGPETTDHRRRYLTEHIRYPLDDRALMGMRRFASLAFRAGLVQRETFTLYPPEARVDRSHDTDVAAILDNTADGAPLSGDALRTAAAHASLGPLQLAAGRRRQSTRPASAASYTVRGTEALPVVDWAPGAALPDGPWTARLVFGTADDSQLLDHIEALAQAPGLVAVRAEPAPAEGGGVSVHNNTAVQWLRLTALLRLALPAAVHVLSGWEQHGRGLGQVALRGGADDLGEVLPNGEADRMEDGVWPMTVREAERLLRQAGMEPAPRDAHFRALGGASTQAERTDRPLRRLDG